MKIIKITVVSLILILLASCNSMLDEEPQGYVDGDVLVTPTKVEQMVISAYSFLGQNHINKQFGLPYEEGSVRAGEAYKGGGGPGDNEDRGFWETFTYMNPDNSKSYSLDELWWVHYVAAWRINDAMIRAKNLTDEEYPLRSRRIAELRFLRGHVYMYMKQNFKFFPYIDENTPYDDYDKISNREFTDQELWGKLIDDFRAAEAVLPETHLESGVEIVGRPTKYAAKAYLAKALLFAAYEQDDQHNVVNINKEKLIEVEKLCTEVINESGKSLFSDFAYNFLWENENGQESIWAIQYSANTDNSPIGRNNSWLIYPTNSEYGCCGFLRPSLSLMNRYKTIKGVPDFDNFNKGKMLDNKTAFAKTPMDPRLFHTACVPEMPWKYDPAYIMQPHWSRAPEIYGYSMSQKMIVLPSCPCFRKTYPFMGSGLNWDVLRMDEVILWKAEALIQLNRETEALPLINSIRTRAANSTSFLKFADGTPTGKFDVAEYKPGTNCPAWSKDFAMKALQWERQLEFATEGKWFFDLVRWGIAAEYMNNYFTIEKTRRSHLEEAKFTKNRDEYFPIPQVQINFVKEGIYKQNYGW